MSVIVVTISVPVLVALLFAWLMDRKSRRLGHRRRTTNQLVRDIDDTRRDLRAWDRMQRLGRDGLPPRR